MTTRQATTTSSTTTSSTEPAATRVDRTVRTAGWAGLTAILAFPVLVIAASAQYDGYSHVTQKISELAGTEATAPMVQTVNFLLLGAGAQALAVGLWRADRRFRVGAALVAVFGVAAGWLGVAFPCDAACAGETSTGLAHNVFGTTGFLSVTAAMFVLPRAWTLSGWQWASRATRTIRPLTISSLVWFIATQALDAQATAGIAQRVLVASILLWSGHAGWMLTRPHRNPTIPGPAFSDLNAHRIGS